MGWVAIVIFVVGMGIAIPVRNGLATLLVAAGVTLLPSCTLYLFYLMMAGTGCGGGDCTGAMIVIGILMIPVVPVTLLGAGAFFYSAVSLLVRVVWPTLRRLAMLLPFLLVGLAIAFLCYALSRPTLIVPGYCDGRMISAVIGQTPIHFPVVQEARVEAERSPATFTMSSRRQAMTLCEWAGKGVPQVKGITFTKGRSWNWASTSPQDAADIGWLRYFGRSMPAGATSMCRRNGAKGLALFCDPVSHSIPDWDQYAQVDLHRLLRAPSNPSLFTLLSMQPEKDVTEAALTQALHLRRSSYGEHGRIGTYDIDRGEKGELLLSRLSPDGKLHDIAQCFIKSGGNIRCSGWVRLSKDMEMTYISYADLPVDADALAMEAVERAHDFARTMQVP